MGSIDVAKRRVVEFFESQIRGIDEAVKQSDNRVTPDLARNYIHEVRLAIRDIYEFEYLSATFLLSKIKSHMKTCTGFERPSDSATGRFIFSNCIITIGGSETINEFLIKLENLGKDITTLKEFRDHSAKL